MGIKTVAVYSDADKNSMHAAMADEAYHIGPSSSTESYLRADKILSVAKKTQSIAIHPGYGFLSENAGFAEECNKNGIIFIGPPASAIRDMGIKSTSKALMESAGVPIIKGYHKEDQLDSTLINEAEKIGFPIMIKAVRGGGGKGMRTAMNSDEFVNQIESARREAMKSFGDDVLLLEQLILSPRHVEVQIFGDHYNNYVYLFERDCSVQRRHQKIIEEAPAPGISEELRKQLGEAAVRAAQAVNYVGAGTVEFIFDISSNKFYFMEMNTRLQVEHPITEMITNTDLVEWQILVASGCCLPLTQDDLKVNGHSVEARIYAEDPFNGFLPDAGNLLHLKVPETSSDVRTETGVRQGDKVSVHYDPMIAKLVVWDENRNRAFEKLYRMLLEFHVAGVNTNIGFLLHLIKHPEMKSGNVHTGFITQHQNVLLNKSLEMLPETLAQAVMAVIFLEKLHLRESSKGSNNPFVHLNGFRVNHKLKRNISLTDSRSNKKYNINVTYDEGNKFLIAFDDGKQDFKVSSGKLTKNESSLVLDCDLNTKKITCKIFKDNENLYLFTKDDVHKFILDDLISLSKLINEVIIDNEAVSPMPGTIDKVMIKSGDKVKSGDPLVVVIAMKMEHVIKSPKDGVIQNVLFKAGDNVSKGVPLVAWQ
ncbi:methylcrotonoyl-CoA carboxylase 1 isoform X2 [Lycorma delicatula]